MDDEEAEWRITEEAAYAATYLFYGLVPPGDEAAAWGRGRRPEEDQAGAGVWVQVIAILCGLGTYFIGTMPPYYFAAVTQPITTGSTAVALLPTCLPIAHGPPMCYGTAALHFALSSSSPSVHPIRVCLLPPCGQSSSQIAMEMLFVRSLIDPIPNSHDPWPAPAVSLLPCST